ncbi:fungal specific transcription factor factor domain protein [Fusarium subglutinans]|uniref:Fungal specific transcription factor factor domain protein n=1 Tax=Gibberella subglutinans TaxID=42677 RepID=A0A8H5V2K6_GIBSU|nr:fungal specific transcription factor factor domain protein [Fusarium subglutinans]KAF5608236.1 fungal specific transcription factor factor domain protein [Fusarium subglutinans]
MFRPETVSKKAWVVYINYMIVTMLAHNEVVRAQKYRDNMKVALNDSRIFLEPHQVNLQALIMLAVHGEDYASPNQSWMLVGHACRQAEALRLHAPSERDYETRQRKLSLFWLLFAVDKSCALAFGRPCSLPSARYSYVPLPDLRYLTRFQPHADSPDAERRAQKSVFGGHMFLARIELAQMIGVSLDGSHIPETEDGLRERLEEWYARTDKVLSDTIQNERYFSSPNELREMELGISTIKFEYLYVSMVFLKSHSPSANSRLETAREAISLLPSMIFN